MKSLFRHLLFSACYLASIASHAVTADNGLVSVSSDSPSIRGILAVGDDFAVFQDKSLNQASASITVAGIGDMKVETPKVVPLLGKSSVRYRAKDSRTWEDPATGTVYPIRIDIEQDTVYVPFGNSSTTLNLTDDSTWGIWDVIWSSEPAGISGRGSSINIPDNLRQGHYTVTAAFSENPDWNDTCNIEVIRVEISPKELSGCEKCISGIRFSLVDSHCPGGVNWEISPVGSANGNATISSYGSLSIEKAGGEYLVLASSKDLPQCLDTTSFSYCSVTPNEFCVSEYGWLPEYIQNVSAHPDERQFGRYATWTFDSSPEDEVSHFCFVQQVRGYAKHDGEYSRAIIYGEPVNVDFDDWVIDSKDTNPAHPFAPAFIDDPIPIRETQINDDIIINLHFKTGIYCRKSLGNDLPKTGPVPDNHFELKEWSLVMRTNGGEIVIGETEGGKHE